MKSEILCHKTNGFTLIEVALVTAILAPVVGIVLSGTSAIVDTSVGAAIQVSAQQQVIFTTKRLREELQKAQIDSVSPDGLTVVYQKALDMTGSGIAVGPDGAIRWGAIEATGPVAGNTYTMSFVQDAAISEATVQLDLNSDGDTVDTFRRGHLQRLTSGGGATEVSPSMFMIDAADPSGDLNGDGAPDPLFNFGPGRSLEVRMLTRMVLSNSRRGSNFSRLRLFLTNMPE